MSAFDLAVPDPAADARWAAWQLRGVEGDRQRASRLTFLIEIGAAAVAAWFLLRLL
jgi:hypothetical protein